MKGNRSTGEIFYDLLRLNLYRSGQVRQYRMAESVVFLCQFEGNKIQRREPMLAFSLCTGDILGDIRINGWAVDGDMLRLSTFVPQQTLFIETLTTREHLEFMVKLEYTCL